MKTEMDKQPDVKDKSIVTAKRAGWLAINIFLPAAEIAGVFRYAGSNVVRMLQRIRDVTAGRVEGDYRPANWDQAVKDSGLTPAILRRNFRVSLWVWWGLMWLTGLPAMGLVVILMVTASDVSAAGWLRVGSVLVVLCLISANGFVQALRVSYRLWQLEERRVSASEKGSFRDFLESTRWIQRVLSAGLWDRKYYE